MSHLLKRMTDIGTDALRGRIRVGMFRMFLFQPFKFAHHGIEIEIAYFRCIQNIIVMIVAVQFLSQRINTAQFVGNCHIAYYLYILFLWFTVKMYVALLGRNISIIGPQRTRNHKVSAYAVACNRHIVYTALPQKHLYVGFMRLWIEVVDKEDSQIHLMAHYHCGNFRISAQRT